MRRISLIIICLFSGFSLIAQSVTTLHDGIELGDSTKLSWYGLYSSARFMSKGTSAFSLHFQNKNLYDFSKIINTLQFTDFNASKTLKLSSSNFFEDYRNQLVIHSNNDTTATIESIGKPYAMLDFKVDFGSTYSGTSGSIGQLYAEQATPIVNEPSKLTMKSKQRLDLVHNHSFRLWENNTLRFWQTGDRVAINPIANILGSYSNPISTLDVNGDLRSSVLAGTGKRQVFANEDGILVTRNNEEVFSYGIMQMHATSSNYNIVRNPGLNYAYLSTGTSGSSIFIPLLLPQGATLKEVIIHYKDNSTDKLSFQIVAIRNNDSGQFPSLNISSSSNINSSAYQIMNFSLNHQINNQTNSYGIYIFSLDGSNQYSVWPGADLVVRSIIVKLEN